MKYQMLRLYCNILEALLLHSSVMVTHLLHGGQVGVYRLDTYSSG